MAFETRIRCVLLAAAGDTDGARDQLTQRDWITHEADEPLPALAELCVLDRGRESRRARAVQPAEQLALVVVDPSRWTALEQLVAATRRYVPDASVWALRDGELTALDDGAPARAEPARPTPANDPRDEPYQVAPPPPSLSGDEISMLLDGERPEPEA